MYVFRMGTTFFTVKLVNLTSVQRVLLCDNMTLFLSVRLIINLIGASNFVVVFASFA